MWSCCGKTICLWSADTGAWLGKIAGNAGNRDLDEDLIPATRSSITPALGQPRDNDHSPSGSFSDGHVRINSDEVPPPPPSFSGRCAHLGPPLRGRTVFNGGVALTMALKRVCGVPQQLSVACIAAAAVVAAPSPFSSNTPADSVYLFSMQACISDFSSKAGCSTDLNPKIAPSLPCEFWRGPQSCCCLLHPMFVNAAMLPRLLSVLNK